MIGALVTVVVDRPLGSAHPRYPGMIYPLNYGYVPGVPAPDGEEQDVYILGVTQPVEQFTGRVIAVVHRLDDVEDKWVVAKDGERYSAEEIAAAVRFQECFFHSEIWTEERPSGPKP